jgi:ligand-binding sensor domain-containing protein
MKISVYIRIFFSLFLITITVAEAQDKKSLFEMVPSDIVAGTKPINFGNILYTAKGSILIANSMGVAEMDGMQLFVPLNNGIVSDEKGKKMYFGKNSNIFKDTYESTAGIKLICQGPDSIIYLVSNNNNLGCIYYHLGMGIGFAPFNFPLSGNHNTEMNTIWIDDEGTLFIGTNTDTIYSVAAATKFYKLNTENKDILPFMTGLDKDSNFIVTTGARTIKKFSLGKNIIAFAFSNHPDNNRILLVGTNNGLYGYDKQTDRSIN